MFVKFISWLKRDGVFGFVSCKEKVNVSYENMFDLGSGYKNQKGMSDII